MAKMGRPKNPYKTYRESLKVSEEDYQKLMYCVEKTGYTKSSIYKSGIYSLYDKLIAEEQKAIKGIQ